jgi:hypothetical protein
MSFSSHTSIPSIFPIADSRFFSNDGFRAGSHDFPLQLLIIYGVRIFFVLLSKYINNPSFGSVLKEQHVLPLPLLDLSSSEPPWQPASSPTNKWYEEDVGSC